MRAVSFPSATLADLLTGVGRRFASDCFHLIEPEIVEADVFLASLFAAGWDKASGDLLALGVVRTDYSGFCPVFCRHCAGVWRLNTEEAGWVGEWTAGNSQNVWIASLKAAGLLAHFRATVSDGRIKVFQPEPVPVDVNALIEQMWQAFERGYTHVYMGGAIYSIGAAVTELGRYASGVVLRVETRSVVIPSRFEEGIAE